MQSTKEETLTLFNSDPGSKLYEYKIELDKINDELLQFGLTPNQAKVFMFLGNSGSKILVIVDLVIPGPESSILIIAESPSSRVFIFISPFSFDA